MLCISSKPLEAKDMFRNLPRREKERQHQRQELWVKVETLASRKPEYEIIKRRSAELNNSLICSPDPDDTINLDNIETESQEYGVCVEYKIEPVNISMDICDTHMTAVENLQEIFIGSQLWKARKRFFVGSFWLLLHLLVTVKLEVN
ncbi:hypothetical protein NQ317_011413 [Molorchus minor]|uniref:Uncharacterized protein n=1 Tax=Molorchus minor TaxID=1323400 RepID=A0ABQ9JRH2_9CUCU|nr:hypothetical protein NQ317_011413 [Molorchus minor]